MLPRTVLLQFVRSLYSNSTYLGSVVVVEVVVWVVVGFVRVEEVVEVVDVVDDVVVDVVTRGIFGVSVGFSDSYAIISPPKQRTAKVNMMNSLSMVYTKTLQ
jgi:hypothetical protein